MPSESLVAEDGLQRGEADPGIDMMAEIGSNVTVAQEFADRPGGFSIDSNDLTQLEGGIDRDSERTPSDPEDVAAPLVERGIDRMSLSPDGVVEISEPGAGVEAR